MDSSRKNSFTLQALQLGDAFLVWVSFYLANTLHGPLRDAFSLEPITQQSLTEILWVLYIGVPFTPLILERFGFYDRVRVKATPTALRQLLQGALFIAFIVALYALFAKLEGTRRLLLLVGGLLTFLLIFFRDRFTKFVLNTGTFKNRARERIVIVGNTSEIDEFLNEVDALTKENWEIAERFNLEERQGKELFGVLKKESVGRVLFVSRSVEFERVARAIEVCELQGVEAWVAASFIRTQIARPTFDSVSSRPMLVLRSTPELSWELLAKELIDRIVAFAAILLSLPLWIFAAVGIKISSPGAPVMFSQMRAGKYGKPFRMWKFRTMVTNAEELLKKTKEEHGNQMDGPVFKLDRDPRIFPFGAFLRKVSIDELPQLFNVLRGEMSLVGPRPLPIYEVEAFSEISHRRRLSVKPGITCEWQAGGRNKITNFSDWVEMDLRYIDNWSLLLDFQILLKTIPAVLFGKGAK